MFGRTPQKLARIGEQFGFATTTGPCRPAGTFSSSYPLAGTLADAHRIVAAQKETGRRAFVDMFSRFSPADQHLRQAVADQRHGPLQVLEIRTRTALLWEMRDPPPSIG